MKKLWSAFLVLGMLVFPSGTMANKEITGEISEIKYTVYRDYKCFYSKDNLRSLAIGIGLAGVLANTSIDGEIQDCVQEYLRNDDTDNLSESVKPFGEGAITIPLYVGAALFGELTKDIRLGSATGEWGERSLRAILVGAPPMLFLQNAIGASRPKEDDSHWRPFNDNNGVSGHSFMGAVPFITAAKMADNTYLKYSLYLGSMLCGWSRINDDCHYFSQAALGWWVAYLAASCTERTEKERKRVVIAPAPVADGMGIIAVFRF